MRACATATDDWRGHERYREARREQIVSVGLVGVEIPELYEERGASGLSHIEVVSKRLASCRISVPEF